MNSGTATQPVYRAIYTGLRREIATGRRSPGEALLTEPRLAEQFGVSVSTIRKAVGLLENEGWVKREQGRGSFVARDLPGTRRVAILAERDVFSPQVSPFFADLARGALMSARQVFGPTVDLETHPGRGVSVEPLLEEIDGLIALDNFADPEVLRQLEGQGIPWAGYSTKPGPGRVTLDHAQGTGLAVRCLIEHGVSELVSFHFNRAEWSGVRTCARRAGLTLRKQINLKRTESLARIEREAYEQTLALLSEMGRPQAFLILDDIVARGVTRAVMSDLAGRGNTASLPTIAVKCGQQQVVPFGLPTIHITHDTEALAQAMIDLLSQRFRGERVTDGHTLEFEQLG